MRVAVAAETAEGERRVAAVPETVRRLTEAGYEVAVERGAGRSAYVPDEEYERAGAVLVGAAGELLRGADVLLAVQPPRLEVLAGLPEGAAVISLTAGPGDEHLRSCRDRGLVAFALELVPRISRAQGMDVLSSQAGVAGYRGALAAAERLPGFFPMLFTAAGTVGPARVLVLGTGVAGLQAIATARRLGAEVAAHDIRPSSAGEVRSLGATFLPLERDAGPDRAGPDGAGRDDASSDAGGYARVVDDAVLAAQRRLLARPVADADAVITTAAVPGRRAPLLLTAEMVARMRPGSVVVDLAAETGGNCELTQPGEQVDHGGVVVLGPRNPPADLPRHASELFAANVANLLLHMTKDGSFAPDFTDEVVAACCVTRGGEPAQPSSQPAVQPSTQPSTQPRRRRRCPRARKVLTLPALSRV